MYRLKNMNEVDKLTKTKHYIAIAVELAMSLASIGLLIYYIIIGDPNNRFVQTIASIAVFLVPLLLEVIFKKRFSLSEHIIFTIYITIAIFVGCALNMHNMDNAYDEVAHFIFGYVSCIFFFFILLRWRDYQKQSPLLMAVLIFLLGMSIAPIWEIMEFGFVVLLGQDSLGYASPEFVAHLEELGLTGIKRNIYALMYGIPVWDTVTDMTLHLGGSLLFTIEYMIYRRFNTPILRVLEADCLANRAGFYDNINVTTAHDETSNID